MLSAFADAEWHRDWKRWLCVRSLKITIHTGHMADEGHLMVMANIPD